MNTYFAPAERASEKDLKNSIEIISNNSLMSGLMNSISGLLAVLNTERQIIAVNDSFLQSLGIDDSHKILGMRPGESVKCPHAFKEPGGCGTSKLCATCGAAIAIVTSLTRNEPVERLCALTIGIGKNKRDLALRVRSQPIVIEDTRFLLLFLKDISQQQQRAALERTFFHDVNNMLAMLSGASELLVQKNPSRLSKIIHQTSLRLNKEIYIQRCLTQGVVDKFKPEKDRITIKEVFDDLESFFLNHPAAFNKTIKFQKTFPDISFVIDSSLLSRILYNMAINALEATDDGGIIKIHTENIKKSISFCVWNEHSIPEDTALRIFQRNFSTKREEGRGIGTYSMKLFGEDFLGGKVDFTTSEKDGTVFKFTYPL